MPLPQLAKVTRILGRKICGNFLPKKLPHILRPKILVTLGGILSPFTPEKKAAPLDPKSYIGNKQSFRILQCSKSDYDTTDNPPPLFFGDFSIKFLH
jgi:hypothetical protein